MNRRSKSGHEETPNDAVRNYLLPRTLRFLVSRSRFYQRRIGRKAREVKSLDDLSKLPVLTKDDAVDAGERFFASGLELLYMNTTTGTTGGKPLIFYRCREELEATSSLLRDSTLSYRPSSSLLTLDIQNVAHGPVFLVRGDLNTIYFHNSGGQALFALPSILERRFPIRGKAQRIRRIIGSVMVLKRVTAFLLEQGYDLASFGIESAIVSGSYLSPHFREWLQQMWGFRLDVAYGLSEVRGALAVLCPCHGAYHFGPMVIPEVVDPFTLAPISRGSGMLLLTSLYPFSQATNFVRYATGDIVRIDPDSAHEGEPGVVFRGRLRQSVVRRVASATEFLVSPTDLVDFLDRDPRVERGNADQLTVYRKFEGVGWNRAQLQFLPLRDGRIMVDVAVDDALRSKKLVADAFRARLVKHLMSRSPDLVAARRRGLRLDIRLRGSRSATPQLVV